MFILTDNSFAVNDLHGYFVTIASDSDNKSIHILSYLKSQKFAPRDQLA